MSISNYHREIGGRRILDIDGREVTVSRVDAVDNV